MAPVSEHLIPLLVAFIAYFAAAAAKFLALAPEALPKGKARADLLKRVQAPQPAAMIKDLSNAHMAQNKICSDEGLNTCTGPVGVKIFKDGRAPQHVLIQNIPVKDHVYILSLMYLMHFATDENMWLEKGGDKTGRTFLSFYSFVSPIARHVLALLDWDYCYVIVKDLAETHAPPYAAKEDGPLTKTYKFMRLVLASVMAIFIAASGLPKWGMSMVLASKSLSSYVPKAFFGGRVVDTITVISTGTTTHLHAGGQVTGGTKHLSLPHSPSNIHAFFHQAAVALGVAAGALCVPILAALGDAAMILAISEAMAQVDPQLLEAVRVPAERDALEEYIRAQLGDTIGSIAFAVLVSAASRHNITYKGMDEAAKEAGYADMQALVRAAVLREPDALAACLRDGRREEGDTKNLGVIIMFIVDGKYNHSARTILVKLREGVGTGKRARGRDSSGKLTKSEVNALCLAIALHLECGYAGAFQCLFFAERARAPTFPLCAPFSRHRSALRYTVSPPSSFLPPTRVLQAPWAARRAAWTTRACAWRRRRWRRRASRASRRAPRRRARRWRTRARRSSTRTRARRAAARRAARTTRACARRRRRWRRRASRASRRAPRRRARRWRTRARRSSTRTRASRGVVRAPPPPLLRFSRAPASPALYSARALPPPAPRARPPHLRARASLTHAHTCLPSPPSPIPPPYFRRHGRVGRVQGEARLGGGRHQVGRGGCVLLLSRATPCRTPAPALFLRPRHHSHTFSPPTANPNQAAHARPCGEHGGLWARSWARASARRWRRLSSRRRWARASRRPRRRSAWCAQPSLPTTPPASSESGAVLHTSGL